MEFRLADPELKPLEEADVTELLNQPIYLLIVMINERDGTHLVHPIWYFYEDGKFFVVSNSTGIKIRSLKKKSWSYIYEGAIGIMDQLGAHFNFSSSSKIKKRKNKSYWINILADRVVLISMV